MGKDHTFHIERPLLNPLVVRVNWKRMDTFTRANTRDGTQYQMKPFMQATRCKK